MKKRMFILRKRFLIPVVILLGAFIYFKIVTSTDVPKTAPNVNYKELGNLELSNDFLFNRWGDSTKIEVGKLTVSEDRTQLKSNNIEIYFYRLTSYNPSSLSPIFFLAGGPGSSGTRIGSSEYFYLFEELRKYADVILVDQRGTGGSIPNLTCRNNLELPTDITNDIENQILQSIEEKSIECAEEFLEMGIKLSAYNSVENAKDIEDLRKALNYDKISLYGVSYGTELAQFYIRDYEKNVDRAILAGPVAPDQGLKLPKGFDLQFERMDSLIKLDKKLSNYIPEFAELMRDVHQKLKKEPQYIQIPLMDAVDEGDGIIFNSIFKFISLFKPNWNMTLTDEHLQMIVGKFIGNDFWLRRFPSFYYQMGNGNFRDVGNILRNFRRERMPNALFFTATGSTGYSQERWDLAKEQEKNSLFSNFGISYGRFPQILGAFGIEKIKGWDEPVFGETNVLLIGGTLDGRTPLFQLDTLSRRFPNSRKIIIKNAGHNRLIDNEVMNGIVSFINDSLKKDIVIHRDIDFFNPVPYKYDLVDTIMKSIRSDGIEKAIKFHRQLLNEQENFDEYIFDFGENSLNNLAYELMAEGNYGDAARLLKYNIELFPKSFNLYNSLGEAQIFLGDTLSAKQNFNKAIGLNYFDGNSHFWLSKLH